MSMVRATCHVAKGDSIAMKVLMLAPDYRPDTWRFATENAVGSFPDEPAR